MNITRDHYALRIGDRLRLTLASIDARGGRSWHLAERVDAPRYCGTTGEARASSGWRTIAEGPERASGDDPLFALERRLCDLACCADFRAAIDERVDALVADAELARRSRGLTYALPAVDFAPRLASSQAPRRLRAVASKAQA